jgi:hypothetical protein
MSLGLENSGLNFGKNKRQVIRLRGSSEFERKGGDGQSPSREENCHSRQMNSRRGGSRNSQQPPKVTVSWMKNKVAGGSLQDIFEGDFKPIDLNGVGNLDGADTGEPDSGEHYKPNPDQFR